MACGITRGLHCGVFLLMIGSRIFESPSPGQSSLSDNNGEPKKIVTEKERQWAQWRGPYGRGVSLTAKPPAEWDEESGEGICWKTRIPGRGHSTPVVWKNRVFLTAAIPVGEKFTPRKSGRPGAHDNLAVSQKHRFVVLAIDREKGKIVWQTKVNELIPREGGHYSASLASASCVTDGKRVFAHFGSFGTFALDWDGRVIWKKQLGQMHSKHGHGEGASPALDGERLFIVWDHEGQSFVAAFDTNSGNELWRKKRDEVTSWSSPIVISVNGQKQLIVNGTNRIRGYQVDSGKVVWECGGLSANIVASPVYQDGVLIAGSSYEKRAMLAIDVGKARGDITGTDTVKWKSNQLTPYVPSLLLYQNRLIFLRHYQGVISRLDSQTGEAPTGPVRLSGFREIYASPVAADGRIYLTDREGTTAVLSAENWPRVISVNQLSDRINASLALVGKQILIRGEKYLYCLEAR